MLRLRFCRSLSHFRPELTLNGISKELSVGKVGKKSVFDQKLETEKMKTKIGSCKSQDEMVSVLVKYRNVTYFIYWHGFIRVGPNNVKTFSLLCPFSWKYRTNELSITTLASDS